MYNAIQFMLGNAMPTLSLKVNLTLILTYNSTNPAHPNCNSEAIKYLFSRNKSTTPSQ